MEDNVQVKAAEDYLYAIRNGVHASVKYEYKDTYNYLVRRIYEERTYSIFGFVLYFLRYGKFPTN